MIVNGDQDLNGWVTEIEVPQPSEDREFVRTISYAATQLQNFRAKDSDTPWDEVSINIPAKQTADRRTTENFPNVYEFLLNSLANQISVSEKAYFEAIEIDERAEGLSLTSSDWHNVVNKLGIELQPEGRNLPDLPTVDLHLKLTQDLHLKLTHPLMPIMA